MRALPSSSRVIARWDDVRDALERPDEFPTIYAQTEAQLVGGEGLLPLGASGGLHRCLRARLEIALDWPCSAQPLANHAGAVMREAVGRWRQGAPFDAIGWFHAATMAVMRPWLGLGGGCVRDERLAQWAIKLFEWQYAGLDGRAADEALAVAGRMQAFVDDRIRDARQGSDGTFLAAVLKACPNDPVRARAFIIGTAVAALPQLPVAAARALNQLAVRPVALGQARDALARDGEAALWPHLREALRFDPVAPALRRRDHRDRGRALLSLTAMHDGRRVPHPAAFEAGRDASAYLIFGCGPHACVAAPLVQRMLPALIAPILRHRDVRRHGGMHFPGLAPERLNLVRAV